MKRISKLCLSLLLASTTLSYSFADSKISEIIIKGNKRIEKSTVESYLKFKPGNFISQAQEDEAIRNLYSSHLFEQISVNVSGGKLIVDVKENPLVVKVKLEGNKKKNKDELEKEIALKKGDSLSTMKIHNDIAKIKEVYKSAGRYVTDVQAKLKHLDDNRVSVIYKITEGPKSGVRNIYFVGNQAYRDYELKSPLITREDRWFRFMSNTNYQPGALEYDKEILKNFYHSLGYADFRVVSATAELSPGKDYFDITFVLEEGKLYQIASVAIENAISEIDDSAFKSLIKVESGDIYNSGKIESISRKITERLADRGFLDAVCAPKYNKNPRNNTVDVVFSISSASKFHLNKVNISGNIKTYDKVIRREFGIHEGDVYNRSLIARGEQRIRGLDYFETVKVIPHQVKDKPNLVDVDVEVEEKSTAAAHMQASYSSARSIGGELGFKERNFFGSGKDVGFGGSIFAGGSQNLYISLEEPHFMDGNILTGSTIGYANSTGGQSFQAYNKTVKSGKVFASYDITEDLSHMVDYSLKSANLNFHGLEPVNIDPKDQKELDKARVRVKEGLRAESEGTFVTSAVGHTLTYNQMDSRYAPKNGFALSGSQEFAGISGNIKYIKHEADIKFAKSFFNNSITFLLSGSVGNIFGIDGEQIRPDDRFNLGDFSLMGFAMSGIGPREKLTPEQVLLAESQDGTSRGEAIGGKKSYTIRGEMQFPLSKELNITGSLFVDGGALWDYDIIQGDKKERKLRPEDIVDTKNLHASFGACISVVLPMMPLKVCYAIPFLYDTDEKGNPIDELQSFHFRMSTGF